MLEIRRNFGVLLYIVKRSIADYSTKGDKHYEFCIRHIKTDLNNHSYIVKQTTGIPREIRNVSPISYRNSPYTIGPQASYNSFLPSTKHSKFKITYDSGNSFLERNVLVQDSVNKMVTHYSTKEQNPNSSIYKHCTVEEVKNPCYINDTPSCYANLSEQRYDTFSNDNNETVYINSNYHENYLYSNRYNQIATSEDDPFTNDSNDFSLTKIKELLNNKLKDIMITNLNTKNIISDNIVILNQKIPERESLLFFKNNDLHVIESSHTNFKNEVKNYLKKHDSKRRNRRAPERLNLIRFSKVSWPDNLFGEYNSQSNFSENNSFDSVNTSSSWKSLNGITLKVKNSIPLKKNLEQTWVEYDEDNENFEHETSRNYIGFSPKSGPPFTEKVPINRDKLIDESVVPNSSILSIINSIDKSAVIIQKDLYITDQIIQKIQKEEEKNKEMDKNKLETSENKNYVMYLGAPTVKNGAVTLSLAGLTTGTNELSLSNRHQSHKYLLSSKNVHVSQTQNNGLNNDSSTSVTVKSVNNDGKISLNMSYEPNKLVPMFSFFSNDQSVEENVGVNNINKTLDNINNNPSRQSSISQLHHTSENNLPDNNYQLSNESGNRLKVLERGITNKCENKSSKTFHTSENNLPDNNYQLSNESGNRLKVLERGITNKCENKSSKTFHTSEDTLPDNNYQLSNENGNRLKVLERGITNKCENKSSKTFRTSENNLPDNNYQLSNESGNRLKVLERGITNKCENKSSKTFKEESRYTIPDNRPLEDKSAVENMGTFSREIDVNKSNNLQDEIHKLLVISNERIKKLETELSNLKIHNECEKKNSSQKLSDVQKLLETLLNEYSLKREASVSNELNNKSEIKHSHTSKPDADQIAQHIGRAVAESLETWLNYNIPKKEITSSDESRSESKIQTEPDILKAEDTLNTEETLLNDNFLKTEMYNANYSDEGIIQMDSHANHNNINENSEDNYYHSSNTINNELEFTENDFPKQEEIIHESEKKHSEISDEEPTLIKKESSDINYPVEIHESFFNSNTNETSLKNKNLSNDNIKESNNKSQYTLTDCGPTSKLYSLKCSNENGNESITNKEDIMEHRGSIKKEGSFYEKRKKYLANMNSSAKESHVQVLYKHNNNSNLCITSNNTSKEPLTMKSDDLNPPDFRYPVSCTSGKGSFGGRKKEEDLYKFVPIKKKIDSSNTNNSSVDRVRKTTISSIEKNDFTDISISEVQTYVDSRLPIPFSTETFFQIFGTNQSLRDHSSFMDVAKFKLSSPNRMTDQHSNLNVMAKLDDIQKSVQYLNILTMNSKLLQSKDEVFKNGTLISSKEVSASPANKQRSVKDSTKEKIQYSKIESPHITNKKEQTINLGNVSNFIPKFSLKMFKNNNLTVKAHNLKQIGQQNWGSEKNKNNQEIRIQISEIKKQDEKRSSKKDEKSLLVVKPKKENIKEIKVDIKKRGIQKVGLTGIKVSKGKYVDLFSFDKNEKKNKPNVQGHKKGVYDHRALSKRDRKILREITKEIPKKKLKGKSNRKRPIRPITSRKAGKEIAKSLVKKTENVASNITLPKKDGESVNKTVVSNADLSNKQKLLPPGKHGPEEKEVQKSYTDKIEIRTHKIIPRVGRKKEENKNLLKSEGRKSQVIIHDKTVEKIKISEANSTNTDKYNVSKLENSKQHIKTEKFSIKNAESRNIKSDVGNIDITSRRPLCQTYVATETYVNQPEKIHQIPEKIFTSKKIHKKIPTPPKVTILENIKTNNEDNNETLKIHEGFKEDLIRKSQKKIENNTNIDFRVRTPKLRNPKSKVTMFKSKQEPMPMLVKDKKNSEIKNKHLIQKMHQTNKLDQKNFNEIRTSKITSTVNKGASVQNMKADELYKVKQSQSKSKTPDIINIKPPEKVAKVTEKPRESEQLKIVATDKLKYPKETAIEEKAPKIGLPEIKNRTHFPMFLIDVDKMSKEIKPELDFRNCQKCQVAHDKIIEFPLHNQEKKLLFKPPFKILNLGPNNDPTLRNELKFFPSVTKVMNLTIPENSRETLREWRKSMINELGENGFKSFYKAELINGNKFNWMLHNFLLNGDQYKIDSSPNLSLKSIEKVFRRTSDLSAINSHVIHRKLAYRGVIDCVAKYQNKPVLIEWKRLENPQVEVTNTSIDVAATQLSAYIGALNYDDTYKFQISGGLLVLAYNDGSDAEVIEINNEQCNKHWKIWLKRLQLYHEMSRKKAM
ncbi:unnamed protein product [Nezara viridula]|uniref:Mitochondrial genome maintenance exonuclease 1 n=1 Tax=Nezara viridula TaxID=85310 RepID=A0A9P0GUQ8_NEZVI|nr:unnamed protein product [Nezara viridula]